MRPKSPQLIGNEDGTVGSAWESSGDYERFTQRTTRRYDVGGDADANAPFNPFGPKSDQHQFSPKNINT